MNTTKFKVGDIVLGTSMRYTITNSDSVCKVVEDKAISPDYDMKVTVIAHHKYPKQIGMTVAVHSDYFELAEKQYFNKLIDDYYAESN